MEKNTLQILYPADLAAALNLSVADFEADARMALAAKLYELGRVTSGQAAIIAGVPRVQFLFECSRYGVPAVSWDDEELASEFSGLTRDE